MNLTPGTQRFTAGGVLGITDKPKRIFFITINAAASTAATVTLHNGNSAGTTADIYSTIVATAGSASVREYGPYGLSFPNGCYVEASSNSGTQYAVISYTEE